MNRARALAVCAVTVALFAVSLAAQKQVAESKHALDLERGLSVQFADRTGVHRPNRDSST